MILFILYIKSYLINKTERRMFSWYEFRLTGHAVQGSIPWAGLDAGHFLVTVFLVWFANFNLLVNFSLIKEVVTMKIKLALNFNVCANLAMVSLLA